MDFYRCDPGYENKAATLAHTVCAKLVKDMHYEARVQAIVLYYANVLKVPKKKPEARNILLSREEYMQVPAWWVAGNLQCWAHMVDKWCSENWVEMHNACRE